MRRDGCAHFDGGTRGGCTRSGGGPCSGGCTRGGGRSHLIFVCSMFIGLNSYQEQCQWLSVSPSFRRRS